MFFLIRSFKDILTTKMSKLLYFWSKTQTNQAAAAAACGLTAAPCCLLLSPAVQKVILSSQSAATVKKDTLSQPALEVQETSSQESSLESETDEEEEDEGEEEGEDEEEEYMDVWAEEPAPSLPPLPPSARCSSSGATEIWDRLLWPGQAAVTTCSRLEMFTLNCWLSTFFFDFYNVSLLYFVPNILYIFSSISDLKRRPADQVIKSKDLFLTVKH